MIQHQGLKWGAGAVLKGKEKHLGRKRDCSSCELDRVILEQFEIHDKIKVFEKRLDELSYRERQLRGPDL